MACCALLGAILTLFWGAWRWLKGERRTVTPFAPSARRAAPGVVMEVGAIAPPTRDRHVGGAIAPTSAPPFTLAPATFPPCRPLLIASALFALLATAVAVPVGGAIAPTSTTVPTAPPTSPDTCALPLPWESYFDDAR